jgi:hypothetical protein
MLGPWRGTTHAGHNMLLPAAARLSGGTYAMRQCSVLGYVSCQVWVCWIDRAATHEPPVHAACWGFQNTAEGATHRKGYWHANGMACLLMLCLEQGPNHLMWAHVCIDAAAMQQSTANPTAGQPGSMHSQQHRMPQCWQVRVIVGG